MSAERRPATKPRLRNGIIRRGSTWSYVIRVTDQQGVSKPKWVGGFATEAEAKRARDVARSAASRGDFVDRNRVTVEEYLWKWLEGHALEVKPSTRAGYAHIIKVYVAPRIGGMRLQALTTAHLTGLYRELSQRGARDRGPLAARTVEYVHAVMRKALADAVQVDQILASSPAARAKRPRKENAQPVVMWGAENLASFLETTSRHRLHAYFQLAAYTGARRGELMNLRWADVHLGESPFIRLRGTVAVIEGSRVEGSTKSGRERTISIDADTVAHLVRHHEEQELERSVAGASWVDDDHVFRQELGLPMFPDSPTALMAKLLRQHNEHAVSTGGVPLPHIRLHDLRHLHATLLLKAGVPVHVVAHRLGHADPAITLRVYAHVLDDQASHAAAVFQELMKSGGQGPDVRQEGS